VNNKQCAKKPSTRIEDTCEDKINKSVYKLRENTQNKRFLPYEYRMSQLKAIRRMIKENVTEIELALYKDLHKSKSEADLMEIGIVLDDLRFIMNRLRKWMHPKQVALPYPILPASGKVARDSLGEVLIFSPWNYPVLLSLSPLVGAISGGNRVILKLSSRSIHTSILLEKLIRKYLDPDLVQVMQGGREVNTNLLKHRFDYIFLTGGSSMARVVCSAASKNLTPFTMELGGKSPTYVDSSVNIKSVAKRIAWGKFTNSGQTCVAPDYILAEKSIRQELIEAIISSVKDLYENPETSDAYGRMIDERHFNNACAILENQNIVYGGKTNRVDKYIEPTIVLNPPLNSCIMQEELFSPILPIVDVDGYKQAIEYINKNEKPLAVYVFTKSKKVKREFLLNTNSGSLNFNIPLAHLLASRLPFGGVGESGTGKYHGRRSFETFTVEKGVLSKPLSPETLNFVIPPYTSLKKTIINIISGTETSP
jgi:aldehyde dehydrogenase (NAD+)